jgi:ketosteroid isomerase-like protein
MQSRHRVEEFIAAFNRKDIPGALACFTDDAIYQDVTYGTHSGQDELKKMLARLTLLIGDCRLFRSLAEN